MTSETNIVRSVMLAASRMGARLWRYNAGVAWAGQSTRRPDGSVVIANARPFHGVFEGHSDTGGFVTVTITPEMVGQKFARALYVEVKTDRGRVTDQQRQFISMARGAGALAGVARSDDDVRAICAGEIRD